MGTMTGVQTSFVAADVIMQAEIHGPLMQRKHRFFILKEK